MTDETDKSLGQLAFEAYRAEGEPLTYDGKPIPEWDELHGDRAAVQRKWQAAAERIRQHTLMMAALEKALQGPFVRRERPRQWVPLSDVLPAAQADEDPEVPLRPQVDQAAAERAHGAVAVEAEDDDELPGVDADGEPEADQADGGGDQPEA